MSFTHVVTFKWNDDDFVDTPIANALRQLVGHLDGVEGYVCGADIGLTQSSHDFAVVGTFASRTHFENYRDHPEHQRILKEMIVPNLDRRTVVQLED